MLMTCRNDLVLTIAKFLVGYPVSFNFELVGCFLLLFSTEVDAYIGGVI